MIKKKIYLLGTLVVVDGGLLLGFNAASSEKNETKVENKVIKDGSIEKIQDLGQLKKDSDIIVEGEKLLMFLAKGTDNEDCYFPVGVGQGIYKISTEKNIQSTKKVLTIDEKLEPQSIVNDSILNDLKGNYIDIKEKLK